MEYPLPVHVIQRLEQLVHVAPHQLLHIEKAFPGRQGGEKRDREGVEGGGQRGGSGGGAEGGGGRGDRRGQGRGRGGAGGRI